jgi:hypothetical protein
MAKDKQYPAAAPVREEPAARTAPVTTVTPKSYTARTTGAEPAGAALPFGRQNYTFMLIGIAAILAGFFIMSLDKEEFGFGFLGLTLGPLVVMAGFVIEFFAILAKPKA